MDGHDLRDMIFQEGVDALRRLASRAVTLHGKTPEDTIVIAIHVDDPEWRFLVDKLMPDNEEEWQSYRDQGMLPIARCSVSRDLLEFVAEAVPALRAGVHRQCPAGEMIVLVAAGGGASLYEVPCTDPIN